MTMIEIRTYAELRKYRGTLQGTIGFVPTMGALHDGHIALVRAVLEKCNTAIASIFVNPAQFAPHEDFSSYPRTLEQDIKKLQGAGCHALWVPGDEEMYPLGKPTTTVRVSGVSTPLEGEFRPHFFEGVATVVAKLLHQVRPTHAFFGEKDWQQLQVIRRMQSDLSMGIEIVGVPIVRDENGLALSSRNAYLSGEEYDIACHMNRVLFAMAEKIRKGLDCTDVEKWGTENLRAAGFDSVDYCTVRDAHTLEPSTHDLLRILAAAKIGKTRLIDNVPV